MLLIRLTVRSQLFRSTGSYEPDPISFCVNSSLLLFRSTGSYEPDRVPSNSSIYLKSFDPQALTSLTEPEKPLFKSLKGFDPQALTSLTRLPKLLHSPLSAFRSTGSYEPDPKEFCFISPFNCFDPQALTSLTIKSKGNGRKIWSFDPQALTSLTEKHRLPYLLCTVSIHRLLRA